MNKQVFAGKFEIQGEIAKGTTGTIYYGYDLELRQEVAIKIYHSHINGRLIRGKTFIEKTKPLLKLDHPNLIKIFKVEEDNDTPIVFMEFFDGPSLQQIIREKGPLSVEQMLILAQGMAEVLVHTHFQGIIHGTLHPGHVLVGPHNQIKVMDLGLSWILMDLLSNGEEDVLRPLPYLPPESAKGELLTLSSDLYSLGFMMYEMLTKTTPYAGLPKTSIMGKLAFDQSDPPFNFPDSVPKGVRELICQITRNKAQARLQDTTQVLTIINQQLARLSSTRIDSPPITDGLRKPKPAQALPQPDTSPQEIQAPEPEIPSSTESLDASTVPPPAPPPAPVPSVEQSSLRRTGYSPKPTKTWKRNLGVVLGLLLLMAGVAMGYWLRDSLDGFLSQALQAPQESVHDEQPPATDLSTPLPVPSAVPTAIPTEPAKESVRTIPAPSAALPAPPLKEPASPIQEHKIEPPISPPAMKQPPTEQRSEERQSPLRPIMTETPQAVLPPKHMDSTPPAEPPTTQDPINIPPIENSVLSPVEDTPKTLPDPGTSTDTDLLEDSETQKLLESIEAQEEPFDALEIPAEPVPAIPELQN